MPDLTEIEYSREACIAAVRDYYRFLTKLYLDESLVIEPPAGGWPCIISADSNNLSGWDKSDEVMQLLARLPYVRDPRDGSIKVHAFPDCFFADWQSLFKDLVIGRLDSDTIKIVSEGADFCDHAPPQVIGLTCGGRNNQVFILDTELGIIHWPDCPGEIRYEPFREQVLEAPYQYAAENEEEADWQCDAPAWAISDFFEILKDQFRQLNFIPINRNTVQDIYTTYGPGLEGLMPMLQDIYRAHGWPNLEQYRKEDCLQAIQEALA